MPLVLCLYCQYIGSGETVEEMWDDVERHERKKHRAEMKRDRRW